MKTSVRLLLAALLLPAFANAEGVGLELSVPPDTKVKAAAATNVAMKLETKGRIGTGSIKIDHLLPDQPYTLRLELADGTVLQGVDTSWYIPEEPAKPDAGMLSDDDRKEIAGIVNGLEPFANKSRIVYLTGDHDRATGLCEFIRDKGFVNDKGGEIIWRVELWYFKYQAGGWEAVSQVNKILRRERFKSRSAYSAVVDKLKWVPQLGGIRISADKSPLRMNLAESVTTQK